MSEFQDTSYEHSFGLINRHTLPLRHLYPTDDRYEAFLRRVERFAASDENFPHMLSVRDETLIYLSEAYIPQQADPDKCNVAFVLGNPAPESVACGAMFAYERNGKRHHRFWNVLHKTGILQFDSDPALLDPHTKMERLFTGAFHSAFNIYILPFYSLASPPGGSWSGVAGLQRLFAEAFPLVEQYDAGRLYAILNDHFSDGDILLSFQKDAYLALQKDAETVQPYDFQKLLRGPIISDLRTQRGALLAVGCLLPTRLLYSGQTTGVLARLAREGVLTEA